MDYSGCIGYLNYGFFFSFYLYTYPKFSITSKKYLVPKTAFRYSWLGGGRQWVSAGTLGFSCWCTECDFKFEVTSNLGAYVFHLLNERNGDTGLYSPKLLYDSYSSASSFLSFSACPFLPSLNFPLLSFFFSSCLSHSLTCLIIKTLLMQTSDSIKIPTSL